MTKNLALTRAVVERLEQEENMSRTADEALRAHFGMDKREDS
jgi:hypothetical protein